MSKTTPFHLELVTELLMLVMALYALFGAQLQSFGLPGIVVQSLAGLYLFLRHVLPNLPAAFQATKAETDLQAQLTTLATTVTALNSTHQAQVDQFAKVADQVAKLLPQQTQTTVSPQQTQTTTSSGQ